MLIHPKHTLGTRVSKFVHSVTSHDHDHEIDHVIH